MLVSGWLVAGEMLVGRGKCSWQGKRSWQDGSGPAVSPQSERAGEGESQFPVKLARLFLQERWNFNESAY